jgi:hypothetical protein
MMNNIYVIYYFTEIPSGLISPDSCRHGFRCNLTPGHPSGIARLIMKQYAGYRTAVAISTGHLMSVLNSTSMIKHNDENMTVITKKLRSCIADSHRYQIYKI